MTDPTTATCTCGDDNYGYCEVHVSCDENCGALRVPEYIEETRAALTHWEGHGNLYGCSHGR